MDIWWVFEDTFFLEKKYVSMHWCFKTSDEFAIKEPYSTYLKKVRMLEY